MGKVTFYSEIGWNLLKHSENFFTCRKKRYQVQMEKGAPWKIYNVPERPGVVYNCLEDAYECVLEGMYVITGLLGEMYPVKEETLQHYEVEIEELRWTPKKVWTKLTDNVFEAIRIPVDIEFEVEIPKVGVLYGNNKQSSHGDGDYLLRSVGSDDYRIINGELFHRIYEIL